MSTLYILKVYNLISLLYAYTCETITTIKMINISITSKSFPVFLCNQSLLPTPSCLYPTPRAPGNH